MMDKKPTKTVAETDIGTVNMFDSDIESEDNYKAAFYQMAAGIGIYQTNFDEKHNPVDYKIIDINPYFERISGFRREELVGKWVSEIKPEKMKEYKNYLDILGEVSITRKVITEDVYDNATGSWYNITYFSPKPGYSATAIYDITLKVKDQHRIKDMYQKLYYVLNNTDAGVFQISSDGTFVICEGNVLNKIGIKQNDIVGRSCYDIDKHKYPFIDIVINGLKGKTVKDEIEFNGRYFEVIFKSIMDDKYYIDGIIGLVIDITERKKMEIDIIEARDRAENTCNIKSEFIANMSHELRTPINVIFGGIQLFELYLSNDMEVNKDKFKPHLHSMKQNCLRLLRLVNNLIDTTKIDSGFYEPTFTNQNIVELIKRITMSVVEFAYQKSISITFDSTIEQMLVMCDVDMIERIMLNLISNAIKYTHDLISIKIKHSMGDVYISVCDNGIGIDKDKHEVVFERYKQGEDLFTRMSEGSGIGLSLTKSLVEMHGGKISVNPNYTDGCEIVIKLPSVKNVNRKSVTTNYDYISQNHRLIEKMKIEFSDIYK